MRTACVASAALIAATLAGCSNPTVENPAVPISPEWNTEKSLVDHDWSLSGVVLNDDFYGAMGDLLPLAVVDFAADGTLTGSTGCRDFSAQWSSAPLPDDLALGIQTSKVAVAGPACEANDADSIIRARADAQILAAINESARIGISETGLLSITGGPISGADPESGYLPEAPVELTFYAPETDDSQGDLSVGRSSEGGEILDPSSLQYGPVVGEWFLQRGYEADVVINPSKLLALDSEPGRRTAWTFDGTTFTTGEGCATIAGTIDGSFTHRTGLEVTSLGDCVLDRDAGDRFDYDLEADEVIAALQKVERANANDRVMLLDTDMGQLVFTRVQ